ncbi:MAG: transposase [Chitinophagales bacterium]
MKSFYRRNLPHFQPGPGVYFITYRLANSLPAKVFEEFQSAFILYSNLLLGSKLPREEIDKLLDIRFRRDFATIDKFLNLSDYGENWLMKGQVADLNYKSLLDLNTATEKVISFCIMPNHVHLLLELSKMGIDLFNKTNPLDSTKSKIAPSLLNDVVRKLKGSTARASNLLLNRSGSFWHHESYDHFVRNQNELLRILHYILNNPVKARLCKHWLDWKWTYIHPEYRSRIVV